MRHAVCHRGNDWGSHSYSSDDNGGIQMPDTHVHSWDSGDSVALKTQLKKMFSKGINRVSKEIAAKVCVITPLSTA